MLFVAFHIFSLSSIFFSLINICLIMFLLGFIMPGTLHFLDSSDCFLLHVREVFSYNFLKYFLRPFPFLFFFWDLYNANDGAFNIVPEISETVLISFLFYFSLFCYVTVISITVSFSSLLHSSASVILLLILSSLFFILVIMLFIFVL